MGAIIKIVNVSKSFKKKTLFESINLSIESGEIVGFVGKNGCGKSVLFKLISGLYFPDCGEIIVRNKAISKSSSFPENIGILIDSPGFIDVYTGLQNLKYLASIRNIIDEDSIKNTMRLVGLDPQNKTRVKNYSLGMKQKLAIAQAIMENQDIILLDEPFNALDEQAHKDMIALTKKLQNLGKTILITSHNSNDIEELCTKCYAIKNKQIHLVSSNCLGI